MTNQNISSLVDGDRNVDLESVEVISIGEPRTIQTRFGTEARVADVTIKDDTGEIVMSLWNDDIDKITVGDFLKLSNGYTNSYRGDVKFNVGRYGTIDILAVNHPITDAENEELFSADERDGKVESDPANEGVS